MSRTQKKRVNFSTSEEGAKIKEELDKMVVDKAYNTKSSYSTNTEKYKDNLIPFTDKHMRYLDTHHTIEPEMYLANLRMMHKIR